MNNEKLRQRGDPKYDEDVVNKEYLDKQINELLNKIEELQKKVEELEAEIELLNI